MNFNIGVIKICAIIGWTSWTWTQQMCYLPFFGADHLGCVDDKVTWLRGMKDLRLVVPVHYRRKLGRGFSGTNHDFIECHWRRGFLNVELRTGEAHNVSWPARSCAGVFVSAVLDRYRMYQLKTNDLFGLDGQTPSPNVKKSDIHRCLANRSFANALPSGFATPWSGTRQCYLCWCRTRLGTWNQRPAAWLRQLL